MTERLFIGWRRYGLAILAGVAGVVLTVPAQEATGGRAPFVLFFPFIAVSAVLLGSGPALLATALAGLAVELLWMEPIGSIRVETFSDQLLLLFVVSGVMVAIVGGQLRRARLSRHESDAMLRVLVENVPAAVYVKDAAGKVLVANRLFHALHTTPDGSLIEQNDPTLLDALAPEPVEQIVQTPGGERSFLSIKVPIVHHGQRMLCAIITDITRQRAERETLALSEERLRVALEAGRMGTWEWSIPTGRVKWSEGLEIIHGRAPGSFKGTFEDVLSDVHPEDRDLLMQSVQRSLRERVDHRVEYRILVDKGQVRWLEARGRLIVDESGKPARMVGVCMDVTERKLAEAAIQESEARFRRTADNVPVLIWVADTANLGTWYNRPWLEFTGRTMEQELGHGWLEGVHPADRERCAQECGRAFARREPFTMEFRLRRHDGEYRWVVDQGTPMLDDQGQFSGYTGSCVDITDRRNAEQRLRALADLGAAMTGSLDYERALQALADSAVPGLADWCAIDMLQPDGTLRRVAVAHPDPKLVEKAHDYHRRFPPDPDMPEGTWNVIRTGRTEFVPVISEQMLDMVGDPEQRGMLRELQLRSYIGVPLTARGRVMGVLTLIYAESGRIYGEQDVSLAEEVARRAAVAVENALLYAAEREARAEAERANQSKDRFLAVLSHELRTPLTPVLAGAQMLEADAGLSEDQRDIARLIRRNVELEARLIDDLLDLTRIARGKLELHPTALDLHEKIGHVVRNCRGEIDEKQLTISTALDAGAHVMHGDPARVLQILWNLLRNAIKFSQPGGSIEVRTSDLPEGRVRIDIRDNGIGIAPEVLPRIFNAFEQGGRDVTRQFGGLGLGLAITKALVELHGGSIHASSPGRGQGATFSIGFAATAARPVGPTTAPVRESGVGCTILLVEDHDDSRAMMKLLLERMGCTVHPAASVAEALELAERVRADLVISDIGLPDGSGVELMRELQSKHALRGIALTGFGMEQDIAAAKAAGFDVHLTKPVDARVLREQVQRVLRTEVPVST